MAALSLDAVPGGEIGGLGLPQLKCQKRTRTCQLPIAIREGGRNCSTQTDKAQSMSVLQHSHILTKVYRRRAHSALRALALICQREKEVSVLVELKVSNTIKSPSVVHLKPHNPTFFNAR
eukprot:6201641-Pleurochrysis_carterae.AAC.1